MSRKVLIASANPWSFALAVEQEFARRYAAAGAQVDVLDFFALCSAHSPHWRPRDITIERLNRKFARFPKKAVNGRDITRSIGIDQAGIPAEPHTMEGMRAYRIGPARVGLGVLSSVTTSTTIHDAATPAEYGEVFSKAWRSAHISAQIGEAVRGMGYDEVTMFNGRHCYSRPFCDVMEAAGSRVTRYEQGATGTRFIEAAAPIHHPAVTAQLIQEHDYDAGTGEAFYLDRLRKAPGDAVNFYTASQVEGLLPEGVTPRGFVAFFTASADEMIAITDDMGFGELQSQFAAAMAAAEAARRHGKSLVVRLHPHLQYKHPSWQREWDFDALRAAGALIIPPGDACDSYALAAAAHCVFTTGSTVGLECSFRGIPNADVGDWVGAKLGAMHKVMTAGEVERFVADPQLPADARRGALLYGSFLRRGGKPISGYDLGRHPNLSRIDGRIVDPVRAFVQAARERLPGVRSQNPKGTIEGRIMLDPHFEEIAKRNRVEKGSAAA